MRRRDFNALLGGSLAWPLGACGQGTATPVIGFLNSASPAPFKELVAAFGQGLKEQGYEDGRNLRIEFRWAEGDENRLKAMAYDLVSSRVALIAATGGIRSAEMARDATRTIPVLFISGSNPVERGLVDSINRPGGNATGVSSDTTEMVPKRLEQLQQLVPSGTRIAMLVSPGTIAPGKGFTVPESETRFAKEKGLLVIRVHNTPDVDKELGDKFDDAINNGGARALLVSGDPFYYNRRFLLADLAARYSLPTIYPGRDYARAGGLMSYAPSFQDAYRQIGIYAGRILHGAKPGDLPVVSPQKWDLVINLKTAKALHLAIPPWLIASANEIID
jgi:putative tryptophan/tyrosine transport system substrate-binding protein